MNESRSTINGLPSLEIRSGIDIISVARVARLLDRQGERFVARVFTAREQTDCAALAPPARSRALAARFAAKEATAKALGTGIGRAGIGWQMIEIVRRESGEPLLVLHAKAAARARLLGVISQSVSLSHEAELAVASCTLLCWAGEG
ncbi:MAG: holo-ACP synthase [Bacillota bacterium]|nr:holo-ACP synthase [Bacillota bacterium]